MAAPTNIVSLHLTGKLSFLSGGVDTGDLIGAYVKSYSATTGMLTVQLADGSEVQVPVASTGGITGAEAQTLINATELSALAGSVTNAQIPDGIMRDSELTAFAVRKLLGLTAAEANDLFIGASITGRILTFTQNDAALTTIDLPADTNTHDGVVASGVFDANGTKLTLTLADNSTVIVSVPSALRTGTGGGVDTAGVNQLIQDALAAMVTSNTETGIAVTYNSDGTIDYVVSAVVTDGIVNNAVTEAKLADGAATALKIAAAAITVSKIGTGAVTTAKLADDAVTTVKIKNDAVTAAKMADASVDVDALIDVSVTEAKIAADAVTKAKIKDNAVTSTKIATDAVTADALADDAVDTAAVVDNAITTDKIASKAVTAAKLADGVIPTGKIADNAITTVKIDDDAVTTAKLDADGAVKQDAFLTRLNALRRDLDNIATLSASEQRDALSSLGAILDGGRPIPSADYAGRVWIDVTNDQAHICRNRPVYVTATQGGFADAKIPLTVQVGERVEDLIAPTQAAQYAYTYGDNHFWVGTSGPGSTYYFGQTDEHTMLGQLVTDVGDVGEWLGQSDWDGTATTRLPTDALPDNRDYFFWNNRTLTIRKLNLNSYTGAGTPTDHWKWESVSTVAANISIFDARDGNLPSLPLSGSKNQWIGVANDGLWFAEKRAEFTTVGSVASWADWTYSSRSPVRTYRGAKVDDREQSYGTELHVGYFYYNHQDRVFRLHQRSEFHSLTAINYWADMDSSDIAYPQNFIGDYPTRAAAIAAAHLHDIQAGESFTAYTGSKIEQASRYVIPTNPFYSVHWKFLPANHLSYNDIVAADDYLSSLVFSEASGVISLVAKMHGGGNALVTNAALLAPLVSPAFTGAPTAPTPLADADDARIATKKYVDDNSGVPADDSITEDKLVSAVQAKLQSDSDVTTIANARALARYTAAEKTKLGALSNVSDSRIQTLINDTELSALAGSVTNDQIPAGIMRDSELTLLAVRELLGLTAQEVTDLFTGATINGQVITYTKNDGSTVKLTIPAGSGGGSGMADGVVASGAFSSDGRTLTLTLDTGDTVDIDVPAPSVGGGGGAFSPTLIFTADDVDLPNDQTTVAITLTAAWDSFDAFYFTGSLRNASALNTIILKEDFQRIGAKSAAGTNWYSGSEPQSIFVLDQNFGGSGVAGMAICRLADTTKLLLARSWNNSSINAQDIRVWGINFGGSASSSTGPALANASARGADWGRVALSARAKASTPIVPGTLYTFTPTADTPTDLVKHGTGNWLDIPDDPPSAEIIGLWAVASVDGGTTEIDSRLMLWGLSEKYLLFFGTSRSMFVNLSQDANTGNRFLRFEQQTGGTVGNETIDFYPVVVSRGGASSVIIIDDPVTPVAPTAANEDNLLLRNGHLFTQSVHAGAAQTATWVDATSTNLAKFKGTYNSLSDLPLTTVIGDVYYIRQGSHFVRATTVGGRVEEYAQIGFIGAFTNEADATRHATAIGNVAAFIPTSGVTQQFVFVSSAFTAATKVRIWERSDSGLRAAVARSYYGFDVSTDSARVLSLVKESGVTDRVATLGVEVVYHALQADYDAATGADAATGIGKLHILTV